MLNFITGILFSIRRYLTGHTYEFAYKQFMGGDPEEIIFNDLTEEALASPNGIAQTFAGFRWFPIKKIIVTTNKELIQHVAEYSEDPLWRSPFDPFLDFLGDFVISHVEPKQVKEERTDIVNSLKIDNLGKMTSEIFDKQFKQWDPNGSVSDQVDAACVEALTKVLFNVSLEPEEIALLVKYLAKSEKVVFDAHKIPKSDFDQLKKEFKALNDELTIKYFDQMTTGRRNYLQIMMDKFPEKEAKDLNPFILLLVVGNISALLKEMIIQLAEPGNDFFERVKEELAEGRGFVKKEDSFLHKLYLEALRFFAPAGPMPRESSLTKEFVIGEEGEGVLISAGSVIIAPLRPILHDPKCWDKPEIFNPDREEFKPANPKRYKLNEYPFIPFSVGKRKCPASYGFIEEMFKATVGALVKYDIRLVKAVDDKGKEQALRLEVMPPLAKVARLEWDYQIHMVLRAEEKLSVQNEKGKEIEVHEIQNSRPISNLLH